MKHPSSIYENRQQARFPRVRAQMQVQIRRGGSVRGITAVLDRHRAANRSESPEHTVISLIH